MPARLSYLLLRACLVALLAVVCFGAVAFGQAAKHAKSVKQHVLKRAKPVAKVHPRRRSLRPKRPRPLSTATPARAKRRPAVKLLSPALVDSFRTIILTSCKDEDPEPLEISMREEMARWLNVRYRRAGISMNGVDCSGFIKTLFGSTLSIELPHSAAQQSLMGMPVDKTDLRFGDLIFFRTRKRISHVGIYLGEGYFVHSSRTFGVRVDPLFTSNYYTRKFARARRVASFAEESAPVEQ